MNENTFSALLQSEKRRIVEARADIARLKENKFSIMHDLSVAKRVLKGESFSSFFRYDGAVEVNTYINVDAFKGGKFDTVINRAKKERLAHKATCEVVDKWSSVMRVTYTLPEGGTLQLRFQLVDDTQGACQKVQVGEEIETIVKPIYKIICK